MSQNAEVTPISYSLTPYTGVWTKSQAKHLLKRTLFGPTLQQINDAVTNGMAATITSLMQVPVIGEPLAYDPEELIAANGTSWVNSVYPTNATQAQSTDVARAKSLGAWILERINSENLSITEKMCLFWQNHFAATISGDQRASYQYFHLIRQHCLGDFKQFVKDITVDPTMLMFLNGGSNTLYSPNENYARELLELFTIGKGPQIGPGDYSNYTEQDVATGAKILTGYIVDGYRSDTATQTTAVFYPILHDNSSKVLSYHFGGQSIANNGANEYADYIDVIFAQNEVASFICTKLYRYFVNHDITSEVLTNVIPDMAATMIANNYSVQPVMEQLLSSEHFYDLALRGSILKGPMDMLISMFNTTETVLSYPLNVRYEMYLTMYAFAENMGQSYGSPPAVAGWPAYYQAPAFYKLWVNATHLQTRLGIAYYFTIFTGFPVAGENLKLDVLPFLNNLSNPASAQAIVDDVVDLFFPKPVSVIKKLTLKAILLSGLPEFEWPLQYNEYLSNPGNVTYSQPIKVKIEYLLFQVFQMPEFQTI